MVIFFQQHVPSTVSVDDDVWEEIRNFKKCLIMMFAEKEKDVVFLETVVDLPQQRRHCLVECIPVPRETDEPLNYFKKVSQPYLHIYIYILSFPFRFNALCLLLKLIDQFFIESFIW